MNPSKMRNLRFILLAVLSAAFTFAGFVWLSGEGAALAEATALLDGSVKSASPDAVSPGSKVDYTIVLINSSLVSPTGQVVVTDMLADVLSYVPSSADVNPDGIGASWLTNNLPYITFTVPSVAANSVVTLAFQAEVSTTVQMGDLITNTANITYDGNFLQRMVVVEVAETPISRIDIPWNNQLITVRGDFEVSGRAWTADQTPEFPGAPVISPIVYVPQDGGYYFVQWSSVTGALSYVLQESEDDTFSPATTNEYAIPSSQTSRLVSGNLPGTYYYRVKALGTLGSSFWSDVESVVVPAGYLAFQGENLLSPATPDASYMPVVEVSIKKVGDADNWQTADVMLDQFGDWWNWTYTWTLPVEINGQQYIVQTRAKDLVGNFDPVKMDTVTVTVKNGDRFVYLPLVTRDAILHPYAPILNVDSNDGQGNYALSWVYPHGVFVPTSYQFQEATNPGFTVLLIDEVRPSPQVFQDKELGTFYYRVRGINTYGPGPWSNSQTILVEEKGFFDDFSNTATGWLRGLYDATDSDAKDVVDFDYISGEYRMWIKLATDGSHNEKTGTVFAPYNNTTSVLTYTVEVDQHWAHAADMSGYDPMHSKAALIFAAYDDYSRIYSVEWNFEGKCNVWRNWEVSPPVDGVDRYHSDTYYYWSSGCNANGGYNNNNHVKVEVAGSNADIYMNGVKFTSINVSELQSLHKVGLIVGSWDWTPVDVRFDNFKVTLP
jgi:uncharacterized repeat protein (TIGR01451 family)